MKTFVRRLARRLKLDQGWSVVLVSDAVMRRYHREFAGKDRTTDVLSFPYQPEPWEDSTYLGDILVSAEAANRQREGTLDQELQILCLHGLLHLLGYDHERDNGEMSELEKQLRGELELL